MTTQLKYQMVIQWSDADDCFLIGFPDFAGQQGRTHGQTHKKALAQGIEALESLVMSYKSVGEPLPEPKTVFVAGQKKLNAFRIGH